MCAEFIVPQRVTEPGAGIGPIAVGCAPANAHDFGRFGERQASEDTETHKLGPSGVLARQRLQRLVERQQVIAWRIMQTDIEVDPDAAATTSPFLAATIASPVHQDPVHGFGRGCEEVASPVPGLPWLITDKPEVRLVDQGCGLECLPRLLVGQFLCRQSTQFVIDQRQELAGRASVALLDRGQDVGDVRLSRGPVSGSPIVWSLL